MAGPTSEPSSFASFLAEDHCRSCARPRSHCDAAASAELGSTSYLAIRTWRVYARIAMEPDCWCSLRGVLKSKFCSCLRLKRYVVNNERGMAVHVGFEIKL
jgi:hypothetical protein